MKRTLLLLCALVLLGVNAAWADPIVVTLANWNNNITSFGSFSGYTFTTTSGSGLAGVTMTIPNSDIEVGNPGQVTAGYGFCMKFQATDENEHTVQLSAPSDYVIESYVIGLRSNNWDGSFTLIAADGTTATSTTGDANTSNSGYPFLRVSNIESQTTTLTMKAPSGKILYVPYFSIVVRPSSEVKNVNKTFVYHNYGTLADNTMTTNVNSGMPGVTVSTDGLTFGDTFVNANYGQCLSVTAEDTETHTLTITAPDGYIVRGYTLLLRSNQYANPATFTGADGTSVESAITGTAFTVKNLTSQSTAVNIKFTNNANTVYIPRFFVNIQKRVDDLSNINSSKCYNICNNRGVWTVASGATDVNSTNELGLAPMAADAKQQFAFIPYAGKCYLYSVSEGKFAYVNGTKLSLIEDFTTAVAASAITFASSENTTYKESAPVVIQINGTSFGVHPSKSPDVYQYTPYLDDEGNASAIYEVGDFDCKAIYERIANSMTFTGSTDAAPIYYAWRTAVGNNASYIHTENGAPVNPNNHSITTTGPIAEKYAWAFIGDIENGYLIKNKATGTYLGGCTGSDGTMAMEAEANCYFFPVYNGATNNKWYCKTHNYYIDRSNGKPYAYTGGNNNDYIRLYDVTFSLSDAEAGLKVGTETISDFTTPILITAEAELSCVTEGYTILDYDGYSTLADALTNDDDGTITLTTSSNYYNLVEAEVLPYVFADPTAAEPSLSHSIGHPFGISSDAAYNIYTTYTSQISAKSFTKEEYTAAKALVSNNIIYPADGKYYTVKNVSSGKYLRIGGVTTDYWGSSVYSVLTSASVDVASIVGVTTKNSKPYFTGQGLTYSWTDGTTHITRADANGGKYVHYYLSIPGQVSFGLALGDGEGAYVDNLTNAYYADNGNGVVIGNTADAANAQWVFEETTSVTIALNKVGDKSYATFCAPFPVTIGEGAQAYTVKLDGDKAVYSPIASNQVPANAGVLLISDGSDEAATSVTATISSSDFDALTDNDLVGFNLPQTFTYAAEDNAQWNLVLGNSSETGIGFYKMSGTASGNKAYLPYAYQTTPGVKGFRLVADTALTTGIQAVQKMQPKQWYDLSGRKITQPTRGLYIVGGKKVVVK